jgi:hypothetical protein
VLPTNAVTIGAATLDAGAFTDATGTLDVTTATSTIRLGTGAALSFADSSAIDWTGGTLNLTGTFVSGSSLRFGTSANALTPTQLAKITAAGFTSFALNSNGYLTASVAASFTNWQTTNGVSGLFTADHDNDGVANGIEYFLGGNTNTTGTTPLPDVANTSGTLSITWTVESIGGNVVINGNAITYTFPSTGRRFARLKVVGP